MWHFDMNKLLLSLKTQIKVQSVAEHSYNIQATSKGSDQTERMRSLIRDYAGRTYHIVGNLMSRLIFYLYIFPFIMTNLVSIFTDRIPLGVSLPSVVSAICCFKLYTQCITSIPFMYTNRQNIRMHFGRRSP